MDASPAPPTWRYILGFLLVGVAWGATTPFMRKAAVSQKPPPPRQFLDDQKVPWIKRKVLSTAYSILDLLKNPAYAIPLLLNVTGSVWFFLLIGEAVPITNSLAFLFTVLAEWWAEGKVISRGLSFFTIVVASSTDD
ncbi:hypothetical protein LTR09_004374 [Extremus antarcticus]|uniref:Integral membrane protein n=1 Tax=Extremus antarcticus TaxID=702011 RepID=A0AAJ0GAP0_9PEZI|nr:hypothetical protein LTR09_004374 [Extremus antarcticus]